MVDKEDIDVFTEAFERTGFRGGVNWYRNIDRNWELTPFLSGAKIHQPSLFIAGELDGVIAMSRGAFDNLEKNMPNLKQKILIPGAGHWIQQERPREVNNLIIEFFKECDVERRFPMAFIMPTPDQFKQLMSQNYKGTYRHGQPA